MHALNDQMPGTLSTRLVSGGPRCETAGHATVACVPPIDTRDTWPSSPQNGPARHLARKVLTSRSPEPAGGGSHPADLSMRDTRDNRDHTHTPAAAGGSEVVTTHSRAGFRRTPDTPDMSMRGGATPAPLPRATDLARSRRCTAHWHSHSRTLLVHQKGTRVVPLASAGHPVTSAHNRCSWHASFPRSRSVVRGADVENASCGSRASLRHACIYA
jgi:hypothetical protein